MMFFDYNWRDENPIINPLSDDWFIWCPKIKKSCAWNVFIKCYINMSEVIATNLRNNIGSNDNVYNILGFLFCIRQALELCLKRLCEIKRIEIIENHKVLDIYAKIKNYYNWKKYGIIEEQLKDALKFMQEKDQIFRYPYDNKNIEYETVAIHLSDWLYLVHALYYVITEEQERNEENA